jgi:hypothetical protein
MDPDLKAEYRQVRFRCDSAELPHLFYIITAYNPDGITTDGETNQRASLALRSELEQAAHVHFPVTGGSSDFSHSEPGFGVRCTGHEALQLARQFSQDAIFKVVDGTVFLVSALNEDAPPEKIGNWDDLVVA